MNQLQLKLSELDPKALHRAIAQILGVMYDNDLADISYQLVHPDLTKRFGGFDTSDVTQALAILKAEMERRGGDVEWIADAPTQPAN